MSQVGLDFMGRVSPVEKKVYVVSPGEMLGQVAQFCHNGRNQKEVGGWQN